MVGQDRYRVLRPLGSGGYADVVEALAEGEHGFQRRVALKRLRPELAQDPEVLAAFIDEARLAGQLHHANIVAVLDFGMADGLPFQVLELVDGIDAEALIARTHGVGRAIPETVALEVASAVARALAYAHEAKDAEGRPLELVHRDVKPSNILLSSSGDTKLSDFGIARAALKRSQTRAGVARGSLGYMAPEQWLGGHPDPRTDVFGLGCVLHALLTGATPLETETARAQFLRDSRVELGASLPADLRALLGSALANDKRDRPATAAVFQAALARALASRKADDPRAELASLVKSLRAPAPQKGAAGLFDLELLLGPDPQVRRFASVIATPAEPNPEALPTEIQVSPTAVDEKTAIDERWRRARSAVTDHGAPEPSAELPAEELTPAPSITPLLPTAAPSPALPGRGGPPKRAPSPAPIIQIAVEPAPRVRRVLAWLAPTAITLGIGLGVLLGRGSPEAPRPESTPTPALAVPEPEPARPRVEARPAELPAPAPPVEVIPEVGTKGARPRRSVLPSAPLDPAIAAVDPLPEALAQVAQALEAASRRVPAESLRPYEDRYFELVEREVRVSEEAPRRALTAEVRRLLEDLNSVEGSRP